MLARKAISPKFAEWNDRWGAPFGRSGRLVNAAGRFSHRLFTQLRGPFGIQPNNDTRRFEYPWCYFAADLRPGMRVLEIGGGMSGFQFVLSREGVIVENVDPGFGAAGKGWECDKRSIDYCNRIFRTNVVLHNCTIKEAALESEQYDRVFSISAIEHFSPSEITETIEAAAKCLRRDGLFILTTDLFLDVCPFANQESNKYGRNIDLCQALSGSGLKLAQGDESELCGFASFDPQRVLCKISELLLGGGYPALVQTVVLRKE